MTSAGRDETRATNAPQVPTPATKRCMCEAALRCYIPRVGINRDASTIKQGEVAAEFVTDLRLRRNLLNQPNRCDYEDYSDPERFKFFCFSGTLDHRNHNVYSRTVPAFVKFAFVSLQSRNHKRVNSDPAAPLSQRTHSDGAPPPKTRCLPVPAAHRLRVTRPWFCGNVWIQEEPKQDNF